MITLRGEVRTWSFAGNTRRFVSTCVPFEQARLIFKPKVYDALKKQGEQRVIHENHMRHLETAVKDGTYTPAPIAVSLRENHRGKLGDLNGVFELEIDPNHPLALTDGGHRIGALERIRDKAEAILADPAVEEADKEETKALLNELNKLPIEATVYIDGDIQQDFLNLQKGRNVDRSHLLSMTIQKQSKEHPELAMAMEIAKQLHTNKNSPFHNLIRFDSKGAGGLPINTLCAMGASDLAVSLVGFSKLVISNADKIKAAGLATYVMVAHSVLEDQAPDLLETGKILASPSHGTKGSATMLCGLGTALYAFTRSRNEDTPSKETLEMFVEACKSELDEDVDGNFSGAVKREYMRLLYMKLFAATDVELSAGVPVWVLDVIPRSAFGIKK